MQMLNAIDVRDAKFQFQLHFSHHGFVVRFNSQSKLLAIGNFVLFFLLFFHCVSEQTIQVIKIVIYIRFYGKKNATCRISKSNQPKVDLLCNNNAKMVCYLQIKGTKKRIGLVLEYLCNLTLTNVEKCERTEKSYSLCLRWKCQNHGHFYSVRMSHVRQIHFV